MVGTKRKKKKEAKTSYLAFETSLSSVFRETLTANYETDVHTNAMSIPFLDGRA